MVMEESGVLVDKVLLASSFAPSISGEFINSVNTARNVGGACAAGELPDDMSYVSKLEQGGDDKPKGRG